MNRSFARLQLAVHQITRRTSGNTTYYSRQEIINVKGASGGSYFCSVQEAMNDYGMSYDQGGITSSRGRFNHKSSATGHPKPQNYESHKNKYLQGSPQ